MNSTIVPPGRGTTGTSSTTRTSGITGTSGTRDTEDPNPDSSLKEGLYSPGFMLSRGTGGTEGTKDPDPDSSYQKESPPPSHEPSSGIRGTRDPDPDTRSEEESPSCSPILFNPSSNIQTIPYLWSSPDSDLEVNNTNQNRPDFPLH